MRLLVGAYTAESGGEATGIGTLFAGAPDDHLAGGTLTTGPDAARVEGSPSWLSRHPSLDVVYAALEGAGAVQAFARTGEDSWRALGRELAVGAAPCHIAVAPDGGSLVVSCWGDGRVVRVGLDGGGMPVGSPTAAPDAVDPYADRGPVAPGAQAADLDLAAAARALREAAGAEFAHLVPEYDVEPEPVEAETEARPSHAHAARHLPGGLIATTDMGLDLVRILTAGLAERQRVALPVGSGPRHTVWHPSGHLYVVTENSHELYALAPDAAGSWRVVSATPLAPGIPSSDATAEVALSRDGSFVYAALRGTDTMAVVHVGGEGASFTPMALVETGVSWPRHHVVLRDTLLVAGQHSHEVVSLTIDERTGVPGRVRHRAATPSPSCLLPMG